MKTGKVSMILYSYKWSEMLKLALYFVININRVTLFKAFFSRKSVQNNAPIKENSSSFSIQQALTMF